MAKKPNTHTPHVPPRRPSPTPPVSTPAAPPAPTPVPLPEDVPPVVAGVEIVLTGFTAGSTKHPVHGDDVREFRQVIRVPYAMTDRQYVDNGRVFDFVGQDPDGRRVYRDQTRF